MKYFNMNQIILKYINDKRSSYVPGFWKTNQATDATQLLIAFHNSKPHFNIEHATNHRRMAKIAKKFI